MQLEEEKQAQRVFSLSLVKALSQSTVKNLKII
ncbi:Hypothetical protein Bdt_0481 [Bdellovibrio bacteriovorus str. Tiberius]|uniref:Uncharacterized protein n=1 Tax=Bdellovibrio bacteriovorus str. Tiberius TaxID=1069642 RepID=K7Z7A9_BDEBC|nr:Hypothetical protein Bdt_0481 [Bdellovibrio bacteriovorus str. Tiberius]